MSDADDGFRKLGASLDRFQEAHFWIHAVEKFYHCADPFRWHLNSFLRAIKEVPQLVSMELQREEGFPEWFRARRSALEADPLISLLSKRRDFVVHRGMLIPHSRAFLGLTEGRGIKLGFSFPLHALEDSDAGMERYLKQAKSSGDFLGLLLPDDDSLPCIERQWRLPEFDEEIVEVCAQAWLRVGQTLAEVLNWLGTEAPPLALNCRHAVQEVQVKTYARSELSARMESV